MQMELLTRPLKVWLFAALAFALVPVGAAAASPSAAAAAGAQATTAAVKLPASVKVKACRSNAWYSSREITFRTRMWRLSTGVGEKLEVKVEIQRKLNEDKRYKRLKIDALSKSTQSKDPAATIYQRDVTLREVETAARYRAKTTFRWRDAATGKTRHKRVVTSKPCRQKTTLPKLSIYGAASRHEDDNDAASGFDGPTWTYAVTVANTGRSEAIDVPVGVSTDGSDPYIGKIDSIGPRQNASIAIKAPACREVVELQIDPLGSLKRLVSATRKSLTASNC